MPGGYAIFQRVDGDLNVLIAQQRALEYTLAGFTTWLDDQPIPSRQRAFAREQAARFLRWRHTDFSSIGSTIGTAAWCYLQWCRHENIKESILLRKWAALEMLLEYAEQPHAQIADVAGIADGSGAPRIPGR